jgi:hypothetical protein
MIVSIVVVLALVGLAIDSGHLQLVKVRMQTAADAAALGAVNELKASGPAGVTAAARADAAANGFSHGVDNVAVAVSNPPSSGYYTADSAAVEVSVTKTVGTFFMGVLGFHRMNVKTRSVARRGPGPNCVYVLDPAASGAFSASGGAIVQVNCGVMVDSTNATAMTLSGGAVLTATAVTVGGGVSRTGGATVTPAPSTYAAGETDPLASITAPSAGACAQTGYSLSNGAVATISEGVYCGGIAVSGGATLRLNPGTYVLKGGGLTVAGMSALIGSGVTFFVTAGTGYPYAAVSLSGNATVQLRAPVSGPLSGILFYQDRSIGAGPGSTITGGATSYFTGALYFPTTPLTYTGGAASDYTILVAYRLTITGGATLNNDYSSLTAGSPIKGNAVLGE